MHIQNNDFLFCCHQRLFTQLFYNFLLHQNQQNFYPINRQESILSNDIRYLLLHIHHILYLFYYKYQLGTNYILHHQTSILYNPNENYENNILLHTLNNHKLNSYQHMSNNEDKLIDTFHDNSLNSNYIFPTQLQVHMSHNVHCMYLCLGTNYMDSNQFYTLYIYYYLYHQDKILLHTYHIRNQNHYP